MSRSRSAVSWMIVVRIANIYAVISVPLVILGRFSSSDLTRSPRFPVGDYLRLRHYRISRMQLMSAAGSALIQVLLLGGVPLFGYWIWHRRRYKRTFGETARRAGLQLGQPRYLVYSLLFTAVSVAALVTWAPPLEPLVREGSTYRRFAGLGLGGEAIAMAVLLGVVQTGFTEELLFRGLIAGSLSRRLPLVLGEFRAGVPVCATAFGHSICSSRDVCVGDVAGDLRGRSCVRLGANSIWFDPGVLADTRVWQCHDGVISGGANS
jgi:membrane protease YdiL (CAAX protease family)